MADKFWASHRGSPFPTVADAVQTEVNDYRAREEEVTRLRSAMVRHDTPFRVAVMCCYLYCVADLVCLIRVYQKMMLTLSQIVCRKALLNSLLPLGVSFMV